MNDHDHPVDVVVSELFLSGASVVAQALGEAGFHFDHGATQQPVDAAGACIDVECAAFHDRLLQERGVRWSDAAGSGALQMTTAEREEALVDQTPRLVPPSISVTRC